MERQPRDSGSTPRSLIAFFVATLVAVGFVVVLARTDDIVSLILAVVVMGLVLGALLIEIETETGGVRVRRRRLRPAPVARGVPAEWSGPSADRRVLLVASDPVGASQLRRILDGDGASTAVLVVAPALHRTGLRYWVSDSDEAIEHARAVQEATLRALREQHVPSSGHVGASDPMAAIDDALRFFDADRIALALHTRGPHRYRERDLRAEIERRFHRPVIALEPAAT